ncbi:glycine-rich protein 5-like [Senna tora]|uniref:Glycine-rich protein 5-like n=1 Tax=Senna tora TaxID=362788 RepID=A0A834TCA9_9FABA|nr:glycine-rich protein 5-like [Senna tora]
MARWCMCMCMVVLLLVLPLPFTNAARNVPTDAGLKDQKNFLTYGGVGGYSGIGSNGLPFGGAGAGLGGGFGGGLGGGSGIGGRQR